MYNLVPSNMISSRPADEEPMWRKGWSSSSAKPKKGNRKKDSSGVKSSVAVVPKTIRIDVIPQYKSGPYKNIYWMHPNMAITRESKNGEEFVGEVTFYEGVNMNVVVNFFTGLDHYEYAKLRFAHTAHTPPLIRASSTSASASASTSTSSSRPKKHYLEKNMEHLLKKLDILAFKQTIIESRSPTSDSIHHQDFVSNTDTAEYDDDDTKFF